MRYQGVGRQSEQKWWEGERTGGWSGVRRAQHSKKRLTWTTGAGRKGGLSRSRDGSPASASSRHHHRWWKMAGAGRTWRKHASTDRGAAARQWAPGGTSGVAESTPSTAARRVTVGVQKASGACPPPRRLPRDRDRGPVSATHRQETHAVMQVSDGGSGRAPSSASTETLEYCTFMPVLCWSSPTDTPVQLHNKSSPSESIAM